MCGHGGERGDVRHAACQLSADWNPPSPPLIRALRDALFSQESRHDGGSPAICCSPLHLKHRLHVDVDPGISWQWGLCSSNVIECMNTIKLIQWFEVVVSVNKSSLFNVLYLKQSQVSICMAVEVQELLKNAEELIKRFHHLMILWISLGLWHLTHLSICNETEWCRFLYIQSLVQRRFFWLQNCPFALTMHISITDPHTVGAKNQFGFTEACEFPWYFLAIW